MTPSERKPSGEIVGYIRLTKPVGASYVQVVDFTRFELAKRSSIKFREENWIATQNGTKPSSLGRNTDAFTVIATADEYFAWWLKAKLDDHYSILTVEGNPGPLPKH